MCPVLRRETAERKQRRGQHAAAKGFIYLYQCCWLKESRRSPSTSQKYTVGFIGETLKWCVCVCHCDFCFSHCSGVRVFCSKAWISFSSSAMHVFTILLRQHTGLECALHTSSSNTAFKNSKATSLSRNHDLLTQNNPNPVSYFLSPIVPTGHRKTVYRNHLTLGCTVPLRVCSWVGWRYRVCMCWFISFLNRN